jgi:hypothetical protein
MGRHYHATAVVPVDVGDLADGFQFDGRQTALARWRERKDDLAFDELCRAIARLNRNRRWWSRCDRSRVYARKRAWRRRRVAQRAEVVTCRCGAQWCTVITGKGKPLRWCSPACCTAHHAPAKVVQVREWRLRRRVRAAHVQTCGGPECGAQWSMVPTRGTGRNLRYCSPQCFNRARYTRAKQRRQHPEESKA